MSMREGMHSLGQEIISSYEARSAGILLLCEQVAAQRQATQAQLHNLDKARQTTALQQRANLAKGRATLTLPVAERKSEIGAYIKDIVAAHQAMARLQRTSLAKERAGLAQGEVQRKAGVNTRLKDIATARADAGHEWQNMAATMQAKRAGLKAEGGQATAELASLGTRVFEYLASQPDGTRLTEMEKEFGLSRVQMAKVVKELMDEGKVRKQDLLYFAA